MLSFLNVRFDMIYSKGNGFSFTNDIFQSIRVHILSPMKIVMLWKQRGNAGTRAW